MEDMQGMLVMQHMAHMECFRGGGAAGRPWDAAGNTAGNYVGFAGEGSYLGAGAQGGASFGGWYGGGNVGAYGPLAASLPQGRGGSAWGTTAPALGTGGWGV